MIGRDRSSERLLPSRAEADALHRAAADAPGLGNRGGHGDHVVRRRVPDQMVILEQHLVCRRPAFSLEPPPARDRAPRGRRWRRRAGRRGREGRRGRSEARRGRAGGEAGVNGALATSGALPAPPSPTHTLATSTAAPLPTAIPAAAAAAAASSSSASAPTASEGRVEVGSGAGSAALEAPAHVVRRVPRATVHLPLVNRGELLGRARHHAPAGVIQRGVAIPGAQPPVRPSLEEPAHDERAPVGGGGHQRSRPAPRLQV